MMVRDGAAQRQMRTLFQLGKVGGMTDAQLLDRFRPQGGEASELAFAALVERHGAMVLRVCRRILADPHDAQDAFQATFLILARKSATIRDRESIAGWLFGVASRVASCCRASAARRRARERGYAEEMARRVDCPDREDLVVRLHEEIARLPERFRDPVVLCDLEGLTHDQAARQLGCPVGTIKSRLARGRKRLGDRLKCRDASAILHSLAAIREDTPTADLAEFTSTPARQAAARTLAAGSVPASTLSQGVLRMMQLDAIKRWALGLCLAVVLTGLGIKAAGAFLEAEAPTPAEVAKPEAPMVPPASAPTVAFDVTFLEAPGLSFRETGMDFDLPEFGPTASLAFLSDKEFELATENLRSTPRAAIARAPEVATSPEDVAVILHAGRSRPRSSVAPRVPAKPLGSPVPGEGGEFCSVRLQGDLSADGKYVPLKVAIRDRRVVEVHSRQIADGRRIDVPEVVVKDVDQRVTIPAEGSMLISLGLSRKVEAGGSPTISERLVLIHVRKIKPPPAVDPRRS